MKPVFNTKPESPAHDFYNQLSSTIEGKNQKEMMIELFKRLIGDSVSHSHFESKEGKVEVSVTLENSKETFLEGKTLHIPKKLRFNVYNHRFDVIGKKIDDTFIEFDEMGKDAPCTDNINSFIIKSQLMWWEVHVKDKEEFTLYRPHWFGLFFSFCGGTPIVSELKRSDLK